jgi:flagellar basal body-associated protein FliL
MQPEAPPAPPPAPTGNGQSNYDFIFNPNQPGKKPLIPGGNTKKGLMMIITVGVVILLMVVMIIVGMINNAGKADTESLISAAKQQQELIRVAEIGIEKAKGQDAKNIAVTTLLALESEQDDMQTAITAAGLKPKNVLAGSENAKTDEALTIAEQTNRFDEEFLKIMNTSLTNYQKSVKAAYEGATSKKLKTALTTQFKSANTLAGVTSSTAQ